MGKLIFMRRFWEYGKRMKIRKLFEDNSKIWNRQPLFDAVWKKDTETATKEMNKLLRKTISYHDYKEDFYHAFLAGIFAGAGYSVESNREHGEGRSDIVIYKDVTGQIAVFEAKYSRKLDDLERDCQKVLDQIDTKMYAKKRNFKGAKTVTTRATSVTIKKLQAKKKYFFRVRTYVKYKNKNIYSGWSNVKSVTIKK